MKYINVKNTLLLSILFFAFSLQGNAQDINVAELRKSARTIDSMALIFDSENPLLSEPAVEEFTGVIMHMLTNTVKVLSSSDLTEQVEELQRSVSSIFDQILNDEELQSRLKNLDAILENESQQ